MDPVVVVGGVAFERDSDGDAQLELPLPLKRIVE